MLLPVAKVIILFPVVLERSIPVPFPPFWIDVTPNVAFAEAVLGAARADEFEQRAGGAAEFAVCHGHEDCRD